jgi:hypothetical protein
MDTKERKREKKREREKKMKKHECMTVVHYDGDNRHWHLKLLHMVPTLLLIFT